MRKEKEREMETNRRIRNNTQDRRLNSNGTSFNGLHSV